MLGDCNHYKSPYMRGVAQAMKLLGHAHQELSVRLPSRTILQRISMWKPTLIWTHMLLWPPPGSPKVAELVAIMEGAAKRGVRIVIHDGDAKATTRHPKDISSWCSLALVNHAYDRSAWKVPALRWPYFAQAQKAIAAPVEALRCGLFFAGTLGGGIYAARTALLEAVRARGVDLRLPALGENTIDRTPEIAASSDAVIGFGRPEHPGWVDTRVWQYAGAGGILVHDDVQGHLEPWNHYVPYKSGSADSVVEALARFRKMTPSWQHTMRQRAFDYVQQHHSSVARVTQVLRTLEAA
jgi:hypothetical protein